MKVITGILLAIFIYFSYGMAAQAHPGNTDSSGGHTCRTNCDSWGYGYGEYHYHGGGYYEEPDYFEQGSEAGAEHVDKNSDYIISHATSSGSEKGRADGEEGELSDSSPDSDSTCSEVNFTDSSAPSDYYDGFMDAYTDGCIELYEEHYNESYDEAYAVGEEIYYSSLASEENSNESDTEEGAKPEDWSWLFWMACIAAPFVVVGNWDSIKQWWKDL